MSSAVAYLPDEIAHHPALVTARALDGEGAQYFRAPRSRDRAVLPGFRSSLGCTLLYLALIVLVPLSAAFLRASTLDWSSFVAVVTAPRVLASLRLTFAMAMTAAAINAACGLVVAWVLVRYDFPGKRFVDALVDFPFALPTAVAGIALTGLFSTHGWFGAPLAALGIVVAFTPLGILVALTFVGLPFVVRTVQPVLETLPADLEEAATTLGARRFATWRRVVLPLLVPAVLTGFALALARGIGEYGSVVFIAGNLPMRTEIAPLLIVARLEQYDVQGATAIAVVMLVASFVLLLAINALQAWTRRRLGAAT